MTIINYASISWVRFYGKKGRAMATDRDTIVPEIPLLYDLRYVQGGGDFHGKMVHPH